jgi:competence ComEA-like helix-hairpin-helix protein
MSRTHRLFWVAWFFLAGAVVWADDGLQAIAGCVLVEASGNDGEPLDVNRASVRELAALPGIGLTLANRIVQGRPYQSKEDLLRVRGIGAATLQKIRERIRVDNTEPDVTKQP